ncbi:MAG: sensor domain-containing diguanylate cyclase [Desulfobaccales bacterium]
MKGDIIGALIFEYTPIIKELDSLTQSTIKQLIIATIICLLLAIIFGFIFSENIIKSINRLKNTALEVVNGNISAQAHIISEDEIGELATAFNTMTSNLAQSNQKLQAEITERRRTSEERDQVVALLNTMAVLVMVLDQEGRIIRFNRACQQSIGYSQEEVQDHLIWETVIAPEDVARAKAMFLEMLPGRIPPVFEVYFVTKGGERRLFSWYYALLPTETSPVTYVIGAGLDITERRQIEQALEKSEERYRLLAENARDVIWQMDLNQHFNYISPAIQLLIGYTAEEVMNMTLDQILTPASYNLAQETFARYFEIHRQGPPRLPLVDTIELEHRHKNGSTVWVDVKASFVHDVQGKPIMIVGVSRDITERRLVHEALEKANAKLEALVRDGEERNREMALLNDMSEMLQTCQTSEEAFATISHFVPQFFPGDAGALYLLRNSKNLLSAATTWGPSPPTEEMFPPDHCWAIRSGRVHRVDDPASALLCKHIEATGTLPPAHLCVPLIAQSVSLGILHIRFLSCATHCREAEGFETKQRLAVAIAENLALALANLKLRETLQNQAIRDPLTGLYNRRYLEETMDRELHRARRLKTPLGVVMMDLDHFKDFNDAFGHAAGDALLSSLAHVITGGIRTEDIACRYGGEEFLLVLPGASPETTRERAENVRQAVKALQVQYQGRFLKSTTISLGIAIFPDQGHTAEEVIAAADAALYRAKQAGRDRVEIAEASPPSASAP